MGLAAYRVPFGDRNFCDRKYEQNPETTHIFAANRLTEFLKNVEYF
jgi:hypothetical protein